eukprot:scaffold12646_cov115-Isochrysis_galbana.AAC.9
MRAWRARGGGCGGRREAAQPAGRTLTARSSALCASSEARQTVEDPTTPDSCILCHASCSTWQSGVGAGRLGTRMSTR